MKKIIVDAELYEALVWGASIAQAKYEQVVRSIEAIESAYGRMADELTRAQQVNADLLQSAKFANDYDTSYALELDDMKEQLEQQRENTAYWKKKARKK